MATSQYTKLSWALSALIIITSLVVSIIIRHRWYLRSKLFHITAWMDIPKAKQNQAEQVDEEYLFDVFVSNYSEDSEWVNTVLLPELEEKTEPPFKLCLYERDWIAGHNIIDCFGESI